MQVDNPFMPNARRLVDELFKNKGWTFDNPTYRREWLGECVSDKDALVYKWTARNRVTEFTNKSMNYILGVDLGYDPDPSAFVLCAHSPHDPNFYILEGYKQNKMTVADVG